MSLRTRKGLGLWASIALVAAACSSAATPTPVVTAPPAVTQPPAATPTAPPAAATPTAPPAAATPTAPPAATEAPTPPPSGPQSGGTLVMAEWEAVSQLNPFFTTAFTSFEALAPALHGLLTIDNDGNWTADLASEVPSIANGDLTVSPDADAACTDSSKPASGVDCFTVTLKLKPGLMWSDGTPLTMNDFKATYDWAVQVGKANVGCAGCATEVPLIDQSIADNDALWAPANQDIKSIDVSADGLTATVTWQKDYAGWLGWTSGSILQAAWLANVTPDQASTSMPVGPGIETFPWNGPFKIVSASSDGIDYDRNDDWMAGPPAYLDHLRFKYYGDKDGMITDFLNGAVDLAFDMTQADFPAISGVDPSIGSAELDPAWQYEHFDLQNAHASVGLDDVNVRTAIAMAIDKQDMLNVLFPGQTLDPACSVAPPGTPWRSDSVTCAAYDPQGAMTMLDNDGWTVNPDSGYREKDVDGDGTPEQLRLRLCTTAGNPTRLTELGKLNQYLSAIGIPSDIQTADAGSVVFAGWADTTPDTQCSIYRGTYDIADYAYILGGDIYGNYFYTYDSSQIPSNKNPNGSNDTRLDNPDMDAALADLATQIDPAQQNADAATIQQVIATQNNEIPLYYRAETTGVSVHVGGWEKYNPSSAGPTWNAQDWYMIP
jgi:peptide/nickel transport system substrate-binding protein